MEKPHRKDHYKHSIVNSRVTAEKLPCFVSFVNVTRWTPRTQRIRLRQDTWAVDYHFENAGQFSLDGESWQERSQGTLHLYAPGRRLWERSLKADIPFTETYLLFKAHGLPELEDLVNGGGGFARFSDRTGQMDGMFAEIAGLSIQESFWRAQSVLCRILQTMFASRPTGRSEFEIVAPNPPDISLSDQVNTYIRRNHHLRISAEQIATAVGVSRSTLTHRYRKETGTSPMKFLREYRLGVAFAMISRGVSLKIAAASVGFYDAFHLSNAFKKHYGKVPSNSLKDR